LHEWVGQVYDLDGWWTCWQFDHAVTYFGRWIEAKLNETWPKTLKHKYTLEQLLAPPTEPTIEAMIAQFSKVINAVGVYEAKPT